MKSMAEGMSPDLAHLIHPDWYRNEIAYWSNRDAVVAKHEGRWVAYADDEVIAVADAPVEIHHAVRKSGKHAFVILAGNEEWAVQMRRAAFRYSTSYRGHALPVAEVEFRSQPGVSGLILQSVIPDTGADESALPWADCFRLGLQHVAGVPVRVVGVSGSAVLTMTYAIWVVLGGRELVCHVQADQFNTERILGRDVLNQMDVLFRGPACEVVFNP